MTRGAAAAESLASHQEPISAGIASRENTMTTPLTTCGNRLKEKTKHRRKISGSAARTWVWLIWTSRETGMPESCARRGDKPA